MGFALGTSIALAALFWLWAVNSSTGVGICVATVTVDPPVHRHLRPLE